MKNFEIQGLNIWVNDVIENPNSLLWHNESFVDMTVTSVSSTDYLKYILAKSFKDLFGNAIKAMDHGEKFTRKTVKMSYNTEMAKRLIKEQETKPEWTIAVDRMQEWKENHKDWYRMQPCLPSSAEILQFLPTLSDLSLSLDEAVLCYKAARTAEKTLNGSNLDKFCIELKPMLNCEHRNDWANFKNDLYAELNLLQMNEINQLCKIEVESSRLCLDRQDAEECYLSAATALWFENYANNVKF